MREKMLKCEICIHYPCARIIPIPLPECPTAEEIGREAARRVMKEANTEEKIAKAVREWREALKEEDDDG